MALADVTYDGWSFNDNGCVLTDIDHFTIAKRDNEIERLANRNGAVLVQSLLGTKPISIEGYYIGDSIADAQEMYDTLAQVLNRQERPLIVPHAGSTRTYTATPENVVIKEPDGLNRITFSFEFIVPAGRAEDTTTSTLVSTTITTASSTIPLTVLGSVNARPLITITYNSLTGGASKTMTVRNGRDYVGLSFSRTFTAGDVIIIDCDNYLLYVNGTLTTPVGRFPVWAPGTGTLYYSDTLTTRNVTITATYVKKYL